MTESSASRIPPGTPAVAAAGAEKAADPKFSAIAMTVGNLCWILGIILGIIQWVREGPAAAIVPVALLSAGLLGVISFVRHAVLHRSDAVRMGWAYGTTNNFQLEVGGANLAWGVFALASVLLGWGTRTQAALTGVFGLYLLTAAGVVLRDLLQKPAAERDYPRIMTMTLVGSITLVFAIAGLVAGA